MTASRARVASHTVEAVSRRFAQVTRAAQYIRVSTEQQKYSLQNQQEAIALYAASREIEIVRTYVDEARSGLTLTGRPALGQLLKDAQSGSAPFDGILVYDVSRWGRFQDIDEGAHYEFLCKSAGIPVHYCAEPFEENDSPVGILKLLKRAMAAEYSREMSARTFAGQCSLVRRGLHAGGPAPYGLRRLLLDENGLAQRQLAFGQRKSITTERIGLTLGPAAEIETIRRIFTLFVTDRESKSKIVEILNNEAISAGEYDRWTRARVHTLLTNEKYIGNLVYNRRSGKLHAKSKKNPPEAWIRASGVLAPIVSKEVFQRAQELVAARSRMTDAEILEKLSDLYRQRGKLSRPLIARSPGLPAPVTIQDRFGSLTRAYALIGHPPPRHYSSLREAEGLRTARRQFREVVLAVMKDVGAAVARDAVHHSLYRVNASFTVRLAVVAARGHGNGSFSWLLLTRIPPHHDVSLAMRLDQSNCEVLDYYFLPNLGASRVVVSLSGSKNNRYNQFRSNSLAPLRILCSPNFNSKPESGLVEEFARYLSAICRE